MILDSGNRTEFSTGAVRDIQIDKGRCDLLPFDAVAMMFDGAQYSIFVELNRFMESGDTLCLTRAIEDFTACEEKSIYDMLMEVAKHYEQGAIKYSERNWQKGIPLHSFIDSGVRHLLKHWDGWRDEHHDRAFVWNMLGAVWTAKHKPDMIDIPFDMLKKDDFLGSLEEMDSEE